MMPKLEAEAAHVTVTPPKWCQGKDKESPLGSAISNGGLSETILPSEETWANVCLPWSNLQNKLAWT